MPLTTAPAELERLVRSTEKRCSDQPRFLVLEAREPLGGQRRRQGPKAAAARVLGCYDSSN
jgi:hypothetical protein